MRTIAVVAVTALLALTACVQQEVDKQQDEETLSSIANEICCGATCCFIDGACRSSGQVNPANTCEICDPAVSQTVWTPTAACPDAPPTPDASTPDAMVIPDARVIDANMSVADASPPAPDAMTVTPDATVPTPDASASTPDAAGPGVDAGGGDDPGGCGCTTGTRGTSSGTLLLALLVGAWLVRRRRSAAVLTCVLLIGCATDGDAQTVDGGTSNGQSTQLDLDCNKEYTRTIFYYSGAKLQQTHWYAELDMPGFDPMSVRSVSTLMCGYVQLGPALGDCPDNAECTGTAPPPNYGCQVYDHAELAPDKLRVFCGTRQESTPPATASNDNTTVSGFRWERAHVRIDPL